MKLQLPKFLRKKGGSRSDTPALASSASPHSPCPLPCETRSDSYRTSSLSSAPHKALPSGASLVTEVARDDNLPSSVHIPTKEKARDALPECSLAQTASLLDHQRHLEEAFRKFDANNDGKVSSLEVGFVLRSLGYDPTEEELFSMVQEADRDGDGFIDLKEFIDMNTSASHRRMEDLREAFSVFDANADGKISIEELQQILSVLGEPCSMEDCGRMIQVIDSDGDGFVDFQEFCTMMNLQ